MAAPPHRWLIAADSQGSLTASEKNRRVCKIACEARKISHGVSAILRRPSRACRQYQMLASDSSCGRVAPIREADDVRKIVADAVPNSNASRGDFAHPTILMTQ
jgi:hypothetical protein